MSKSTRLKFYIILPVLILILGLVIYNNYGSYTSDKKCEDFTLTSSPIDLDKIKGIIPLGALSPPSHTFPTDHIYFVLPEIPGTDTTETVNLYSPGDLWIVSVRASEQLIAGTVDYAMFLEPENCPEISIMFIHVSSLNNDVFQNFAHYSEWDRDSEYTTGGETYRTYSISCSIEVYSGELIGTAGGTPGQRALDLGVYDTRYKPDKIANPERWKQVRYLNTLCPLSLYKEGEVKEALYDLLLGKNNDSICGSVLQDEPGTAQGCWFLDGVENTYPEDSHIALIRDSMDSSLSVFSVGVSVQNLDSGRYYFIGESTGALNLDFNGVTSDDQNHVYKVQGFEGLIMIHMPDESTLWVEAFPNSTSEDDLRFSNLKTIFVR